MIDISVTGLIKSFDLADADIAVLGQAAAQRFLRQRDGVQKLVVAV